ncbi:AWAT2 isoform 3, partial [Pan troglodytes]
EASGFSKIFPGITPYILTLGAFFWMPFLREYVMSTGACSVSRSSIDFLLTHKGTGNMVIVVIGGLAECRYSLPGSSTLVLKNRSGFVRMALQHGQPGVGHGAPTLNLDLGTAGLGSEKPVGRPRDHGPSACLAFDKVPTFLGFRGYAFALQGASNTCLCLWGDGPL